MPTILLQLIRFKKLEMLKKKKKKKKEKKTARDSEIIFLSFFFNRSCMNQLHVQIMLQ